MKLKHNGKKEAALEIWRRDILNRSNRSKSPRREGLEGVHASKAQVEEARWTV